MVLQNGDKIEYKRTKKLVATNNRSKAAVIQLMYLILLLYLLVETKFIFGGGRVGHIEDVAVRAEYH